MSRQETDQPQIRRNSLLSAFRELLEIIRDYGMATVAFGTGIYAFILVLQAEMAPEFKVGVALVLTVLGLAAQLWMHARLNPRKQSDEVREQLTRMTDLVQHLVENKIK